MTNLIRAELLRYRTTRMTAWMALGLAVGVVLTLAAAIVPAGQNGLAPLDSTEGVRNVMAAAATGTTLMLFLGIIAMAGEFRHGTATPMFLVTPDRGRVVAAKLAAAALVGLVFSAAAVVLTLGIGIPWLGSEGVDATSVAGDVAVVLLGAVVATVLYGAVGVGVGSLVRNQTTAVVLALVWVMIVESLLIGFAPEAGRWLPGGAAAALTNTPTSEGGLLPMWGGGVLFAAYAAAFAMAGTRFTVRRDIT